MKIIVDSILDRLIDIKKTNNWNDQKICEVFELTSILDIATMNVNQLVILKEIIDFDFDEEGKLL